MVLHQMKVKLSLNKILIL